MRRAILCACVLALSGCVIPPAATAPCPKPQTWNRADQIELARELSILKHNLPMIDRMALDWERMRAELRACRDE